MEHTVKTAAGPLLAAAVAVMWLAPPGAAHADRQTARSPEPAQATQPTIDYVGEDTCLTCHKDQAKGYHSSAHGRASNSKTPVAGRGCESCHGPGQAHVESGGDTSKITTFTGAAHTATNDAPCLQCHVSGDRALWAGSQHDALNVSCIGCHSVHAPKSEKSGLKGVRQIETCERCHRSEVQKMRRSSHMPVAEGSLECSSCHNPHGTTGVHLLKAGTTVNQTCERCHAEKRGPHLWEHAPVVESCTTCHDAHGSTNARMLVAKEPVLCQRCHVTSQHPATAYDGYALANSTNANRMYGRSCAACHQNIHGSNAPSGKAFLR